VPFSRLRFLADKLIISATENDAGAAVFEIGTVQGMSGLILKKIRVGDLSVKTIHLKEGSVTVPVMSQLGSNFNQSGAGNSSEFTFIEQNITTKGVAGSPIFVACMSQITGAITSTSPSGAPSALDVRVLVNDAEVLAFFRLFFLDGGGVGTPSNPNRMFMTTVPASGSSQTINVKWRVRYTTTTGTGVFRIDAGSRALAIAMKR